MIPFHSTQVLTTINDFIYTRAYFQYNKLSKFLINTDDTKIIIKKLKIFL